MLESLTHEVGTLCAIATHMLQRYFLAFLPCLALSACGADMSDDEVHDVNVKAGASTQLQIRLDAPTQLSLISDASGLNSTIKVTSTDSDGPDYESEWAGTPFVDVMEEGTYTIEITNDSSEPLLGSLYQTLR